MKGMKGVKLMKKSFPGLLVFFMSFMQLHGLHVAGPGTRTGCCSARDDVCVKPARVFDGDAVQEGWAVVVRGQRIESAGPAATARRPPAP